MKAPDPKKRFAAHEKEEQFASKPKRADRIVAETKLSPGQKALWFLQQLAPENPAYHIFRAVEIKDNLDIEIFRATMQIIADRHPTLRTTFSTRNGEPVQQIYQSMEVEFKLEDASSWSEDQLNQCLDKEALRPFDLEQGPLFRVTLFCRSAAHYLALFNLHHIITDLWSLAIMITEIGLIYDSMIKNERPLLPVIEMDYSDHVRTQIEMLSGPEGDRMWQFWKQKLAGDLPILNLPVDRIRPPIQTYLGASQAIQLGTNLVQPLKAIARANRVSLFSMLMAAFQVLLFKYSAQEDIIVGTPKSGRGRKTIFTHGYFVNSVPLRVNCLGDPLFTTFLKQVHQAVQEASEHEAYPFSLLVERLKPERDSSRSPLFQTFFTMQKTTRRVDSDGMAYFAIGESGGSMNWGSLLVFSRGLRQRIAPFDLTMLVAETTKDFLVSLQYNIDLFDPDTVERMLKHYQQLLKSIVIDPTERISNLEILSQQERKQLLQTWNDTDRNFAHDKCFHELFEQQARHNPAGIALVFDEKMVTYGELNQKANRLAHYLRRTGIEVETIVAISFERSIEMIIALLGVLKAGGAYLPLDPTYPDDRLKFMVEDSGVEIFITQQSLVKKFLDYDVKTICLDTDWKIIDQQSAENPIIGSAPDNLAYVIYTSGSTGKPKGTMVIHRGICNLAAVLYHTFKIDESDNILQFSSLSFDASVWEIVMALAHGAKLVITRQEQLIPSHGLIEFFNDNRISLVTVPPSVLAVIPDASLPDLRIIITAGEPCTKELVKCWWNGHKFFNAYGPTETTVCASIFEVNAPIDRNPPIGRPISNFQLYILDDQLQPVPIGIVGELYIAGVGLARGYLHEPGFTAEKFVANPFSKKPGQCMYRSGDLARYLPDGNIEFLGRLDHQVKVRGFRIELQEIETVLSTHPSVKQNIVVAKRNASGEIQIVAYVSHAENQSLDAVELRNFLKQKLPEFMIPSVIVILESLPHLPNGKIDRKALVAITETPTQTKVNQVNPQTEVEKLLATIWQEVLHLESIGIHDNFFDIGGHSLAIIKVQSQLNKFISREISVVDFFKYPTICSFAKFLNQTEAIQKISGKKQERVLQQRKALEAGKQRMRKRRFVVG